MKWLKKVAATPLTSIARVVDSLKTQTNDRTNAPSIRAVNDAIAEQWQAIYPIGSIYMSINNVDPSEVFGGTWQQIKDTFLLASGDSYSLGDTGGSATHTPSGTVDDHTLTIQEMPEHNHSIAGIQGLVSRVGGGNEAEAMNPSQQVYTTSSAGGGAPHSHGFTGTEQDTMPPYVAVNVWVRMA